MLERVAGAEIFCYVALITDVAREHSTEKNIIDKSLIFFFYGTSNLHYSSTCPLIINLKEKGWNKYPWPL